MKKFLSAILAVSMILSMTACADKNSGSESSAATSDSGVSDSSVSDSGQPSGESHLSNPVKRTEDGDIDMTAALSYETDFDALKSELASRTVDPSQPVSLNARNNASTMEVWNYLTSIYGKQIMSCQQQMNISKHYEDKVYYNATEDLPAMKGFDFIFCTGSYSSRDMIDGAIDWAKNSGGLVTFTWHWNVPRDIDNADMGWAFYQEDIINFNPLNATTPGTKEYEVAVHDIDLIAGYLQEMEAQGITVLFRPFHEASGAWFWWGLQPDDKKLIKEGTYPETYQRLYYMMFDRLENYHKLSNIIWVWNGQSKYCTVDPNTYDIAGIDFYANEEDHSPAASKYDELASYTYEGKMLALSECGYIPDPQQCADENKMWLYYMPWNDEFVYLNSSIDMNETAYPNPERMTNEMLVEYFSNEHFVSWNDLPEFSFGEKKLPEKLALWKYEKENSAFS
ncbi:MAG: glycosyl hydrolase [Oscillospiraceae bacterium]